MSGTVGSLMSLMSRLVNYVYAKASESSLYFKRTQMRWEHSRSVPLYKMLALSSPTVANFIQRQHVGLLLSFNICCQFIITMILCGHRIHWLCYKHPIVFPLRKGCGQKNENDCGQSLKILCWWMNWFQLLNESIIIMSSVFFHVCL